MTNTLSLEIGRRVHCILYGGNTGTVYNIDGDLAPETIRTFGRGVGVMGGNARIDIVWDDGRKAIGLSEALVCGSVQWRILDDVKDQDYIRLALDYAEVNSQLLKLKEEVAKAKFDAEVSALKDAHPELEPVEGSKYYGGTHAARNIRKELKAAFKGVKFRVTSDYSCVNVYWDSKADGAPTLEEIEAVISKYDVGRSHPMEDYHDTVKTPWSVVFGGVEFLFIQHDYRADAKAA